MSPPGFRVLWPEVGPKGTMKHMAGRKRHSAEDIVRKLRRADELAAEGKNGEEIAAELGVSAATLYNWRRAYGGMDTDAAKELKELREHNVKEGHSEWHGWHPGRAPGRQRAERPPETAAGRG